MAVPFRERLALLPASSGDATVAELTMTFGAGETLEAILRSITEVRSLVVEISGNG